ncbi:hypothetical protein GLYMA_13G063050v4 [Glycine max]|nr:hypothetical protein GLYMA_13G063050v4 [Glycine max]KAH1100094.1 hypothetical protein GYH30_035319 [Glycine max]
MHDSVLIMIISLLLHLHSGFTGTYGTPSCVISIIGTYKHTHD